MTFDAQRDVLQRLLRAFESEQLLSAPLIPASDDPVQVLQQAKPLLTVDPTNFDRALAELADGITGLARAHDGIVRRYAGRTALGNLEQLVWQGHPQHPCAKTSLGIGADYARYLPEQVEWFPLRFLAVRNELCATTGLSLIDALRSHIPGLAGKLAAELPEGFSLVPVHPWQLEHVISLNEDIRLLDTTAHAEPLLSVRTLRVSDDTGQVDIKTSVNFQLTGAIRGLSESALAGPIIAEEASKLIHRQGIAPYTVEDVPAFQVGHDLAGIRVSSELGAIVRKTPTGIPVAALTATNPITGRRIFDEVLAEAKATPIQWCQRLVQVLVTPALRLLDYGLALEPHPQNTVVELRNGWPYRVTVRDFGGCRILVDSQFYKQRDWSFLAGTALITGDEQAVRNKLLYPLITNLMASLSTEVPIDGLPALLPRKRVFAMRLSGAVTEQDYVFYPNPFPATTIPDYGDWARKHVAERIDIAKQLEGFQGDPDPADVANAVTNLKHVRETVERRQPIPDVPPDFRGVLADSLNITGHNVHPLAKLRRGFSLEDSKRYGPENFTPTHLKLIGVPHLAETGDITAILRREFPELIPDTELRVVPVHPWQWEHVVRHLDDVVDLGATLPVLPTLSVRTGLSYHPGSSGNRLFFKTSLSVVLTSTKRSISAHSALGTPLVAQYLHDLLPHVTIQREIAGCTHPDHPRALSMLIREAGLGVTAAAFKNTVPPPGYVEDLLQAVLPTMWHHGIALEAHLQNTALHFGPDGNYQKLVLRDFSGLRIYNPRAGAVPAHPEAVTRTNNYDEFLNKGHYALLFGNLSGWKCDWKQVREIVDKLIDEHRPPESDVAALLAPTLHQKAFLTMSANPAAGDVYVSVPNPLYGF